MKKLSVFLLALAPLLLSGCVHTMSQEEINTVSKNTAEPCKLSESEQAKYTGDVAMTPDAMIKIYSASNKKNIDGCAGVAFQLDAKGKTTHVQVVKENPKGSGFGEEFAAGLRDATFAPPKKAGERYYLSTSHIRNPNVKDDK